MADYYPLLARALDALPDRSPAMRKAVYERARSALIGQLRSLDPPLAEADIALESTALDSAISRLEETYAPPPPASPTPAPAVEPAPASIPEPEPPAAPDPEEALFEATTPQREPGLPPATPPDLGLPKPPEPRRREGPPLSIAPRRGKETGRDAPRTAPAAESPPQDALLSGAADAEAGAVRPEGTAAQRRPRVAVVSPGGSRSKILRNVFVGGVLTIVIGLIAVAAFLLRDRPADLQPTGADIAGQQPDRADSKFGDRIGGDVGQQGERPGTATGGGAPGSTAQTAPTQPQAPLQSDVTVAQRAALVEENLADPNAPPPISTGRVVWRLDSVSGEQGQPLETAVVATVDIPDAGLQFVMTIQRNLDATLPASHTVKLSFSATGPGGEKRTVQDVGLLQGKDEENARGSPVSGLPVRVRENLFLIGLSSLKNDVDRNTDLLLHKNWFDLALKYASGQRAVITFEKGSSGEQVMQRAFDQWR